MTSAEFLYELRKRLRKLPSEEIDQAMSYYEEYFAEAGPAGEAALIGRLGTPAQVAANTISDYAMKSVNDEPVVYKKDSSIKTMWIVILSVVASPIAVPLAIALVAVVFSLLIVLFSLFFSLFVTALGLTLTGVIATVLSIIGLFSVPLEAITILGSALVCLALGVALGLGTIKLTQLTIKGITKIFAKILGKKGGTK